MEWGEGGGAEGGDHLYHPSSSCCKKKDDKIRNQLRGSYLTQRGVGSESTQMAGRQGASSHAVVAVNRDYN
jgi:hypothetical protein